MSHGGVQSRKRKRGESLGNEGPDSPASNPPTNPPVVPSEEDFRLGHCPTTFAPSSPRQTSPSVGSPLTPSLPLTRANLHQIDPTMPPQTPSSTKRSIGKIARDGASTGSSKNVNLAIKLLAKYHVQIENEVAEAQNEDFLEEAKELVVSERLSAIAAKSIERMKATYSTYKLFNEATFLVEFWKVLINESRLVKEGKADPPVSVPWLQDHVAVSRDQLFRSDCLPELPPAEPMELELFKVLPKIALPKPDLCYGLLPSRWCSKQQLDVINRYARYTMPDNQLVLPWFVVEGKSNNGNLEEAAVQASRAGATLCASFRKLDEIAGSAFKGDGPDCRSYVYSLVLSPRYARINVHWVMVESGHAVDYHLHILRDYKTYKSTDWSDLRRDVDNILDWGAIKRKNMVLGMLSDILARYGDDLKDAPAAAPIEGSEDELDELAEAVLEAASTPKKQKMIGSTEATPYSVKGNGKAW
ncbi:MAG: hypothetical protein Q9201_001689 [Fulgogasparrea decipioides]